MAVIKPYTFVAGTKAKANEVNENFDVLFTEINALGSTVVDYQAQIEQLASEKANINGNYANRFSVANPTTNYDAVNKQTLFNAIGNSLPYIYGLGVTRAGNNTINVNAGSCYDTTETQLLVLENNLAKQNATQAANTSYYVYIIGKTTGNEDILISSLSVSPNLPDGYTYYRRLGSYTTDSSNKIIQVYNEQINQYTRSNFINQNIAEITNKVAPNYTAGYSISSGFAAPSAGWVACYGTSGEGSYTAWYVDGAEVFRDDQSWGGGRAGGQGSRSMAYVGKGSVVTRSGNNNTAMFYPCKGV